MPAFILARILQAIPVLLVVAFIAFALFAYVGNPVAAMVGQEATAAERAAMAHQLGLDQPMIVQYGRFVGRVLHGDFGISYRLARPVAGLIVERAPAAIWSRTSPSLLASPAVTNFPARTPIEPVSVVGFAMISVAAIDTK